MNAVSAVEQFAEAIVARDFDRAEALLAPWIRAALPEGGLKRLVRLARQDNPPADAFEIAGLPYNTPESMREHVAEYASANGGRTLATADGSGGAFGPPAMPIPDEITDATFLGVWQIQFQPDPDLEADVDYSYAFYVAVVTHEDGARIGYIDPMD